MRWATSTLYILCHAFFFSLFFFFSFCPIYYYYTSNKIIKTVKSTTVQENRDKTAKYSIG